MWVIESGGSPSVHTFRAASKDRPSPSECDLLCHTQRANAERSARNFAGTRIWIRPSEILRFVQGLPPEAGSIQERHCALAPYVNVYAKDGASDWKPVLPWLTQCQGEMLALSKRPISLHSSETVCGFVRNYPRLTRWFGNSPHHCRRNRPRRRGGLQACRSAVGAGRCPG